MHHHHDKDPGFMPMQGRSFRPLSEHRLKVRFRRQERRKLRAALRSWLGETEPDAA